MSAPHAEDYPTEEFDPIFVVEAKFREAGARYASLTNNGMTNLDRPAVIRSVEERSELGNQLARIHKEERKEAAGGFIKRLLSLGKQ